MILMLTIDMKASQECSHFVYAADCVCSLYIINTCIPMVNILPLFLSLRPRQWPNAVNVIHTHFMLVGDLFSVPLHCSVVLLAVSAHFS